MIDRMIGAMRLDVATFEAIEHDESATTQAGIIVVGVALLQGVAGIFSAIAGQRAAEAMEDAGTLDQLGDLGLDLGPINSVLEASTTSPVGGFLSAVVTTLLLWAVVSGVTYFVGTRFFGAKATFQEMLRVIGFAQTPRIVGGLLSIATGILPVLGCLTCFAIPAVAIWGIAVSFVGIRQGLDLDNGKTAMTLVASLIPAWILMGIVSWGLGLVF